ncbi:MAG TPA: hypothetical protein VH063_04675 [Gaiellaceae bacterium]|jgi:Mn-dependent DtxR family transcriptional regulator|nr:hypothetical protein [Gaiellaceae bacterium]
MSEPALLWLLLRYPHPVAIARRVSASSLHEGLRRLEGSGYVSRRRGLYVVTERGRHALEFSQAVQMSVQRALL